jgi:hypothetical protein
VIKEWSGGRVTASVGYVIKRPERNVIRLEKTWKVSGGKLQSQRYNIGRGDWTGIKRAIEALLPEIGDAPTEQDIDGAIRRVSQETQLLELVARYPELLTQMPKDVDILSLPRSQKDGLRQLLTTGGEIANSVITKLAQQPIGDIEQFSRLLDHFKLSTVNSLVTHITGRIEFVELFERVIHDDSSYERRGPKSVHNLLRQNIWIVDQNYAVLHDDETLKNIIAAQWGGSTDSLDRNRRPDFLCMTDRQSQDNGYKKLVLIEIKRPSVRITMEHIQQVMQYRTLLQRHSGVSNPSFECYVIGREVDEYLLTNPLTDSGFSTPTYTDFIGRARKFYRDYFEIVKSEEYAF